MEYYTTQITHFTRKILVNRLTNGFSGHPYYGTGGTEPAVVSTRKGFDFKRLPAILVHTPSGDEEPMDMGQFIEDLSSHVQLHQQARFISEVYEAAPNPLYPASFINDTYTLTVKAQRTVTILPASTGVAYDYDFVEDTLVDDVIPGMLIRFGSLNNVVVGEEAVIKTYATPIHVGEIHGGRHGNKNR